MSCYSPSEALNKILIRFVAQKVFYVFLNVFLPTFVFAFRFSYHYFLKLNTTNIFTSLKNKNSYRRHHLCDDLAIKTIAREKSLRPLFGFVRKSLYFRITPLSRICISPHDVLSRICMIPYASESLYQGLSNVSRIETIRCIVRKTAALVFWIIIFWMIQARRCTQM